MYMYMYVYIYIYIYIYTHIFVYLCCRKVFRRGYKASSGAGEANVAFRLGIGM